MKILFVHEVSYRKKVVFEMHEFPELLAMRGHEISFLEFDEGRKFWVGSKPPREESISGRVHDEAKVNLYRPFQLGIPGLDRLLAVLTVVFQLRRILRENTFDAIVLYAVPTYGLQTLWFSRKYHIPVMFRALDVSHKIRSSLLSPLIRLVEKIIYKAVDYLSANNEAMASYCNELGKRTKTTKVHYPPLDLNHFQEGIRDISLRRSLGFSDEDRVLVYMGSFFYFSGLGNALREFSLSSANNPNLKMLLIGGGEQERELKRLVEEIKVRDKVVFTGFIRYEDLPIYLKVADIALNTLEPTLVANVAFPNKVLQYLAAGLPVVSTKLQGLMTVFDSEKSILWRESASDAVKTACRISKKELLEMSSGTEKKLSLSKFAPAAALERFESELELLTKASD